MELRSLEQRLEELQQIISRVVFQEDEDMLFDIPTTWVSEWTIGETYKVGRLIKRHDKKYLVVNSDIVASKDLYPETVSGRSNYLPFQGMVELYGWMYGERIVAGMKRIYEGNTYLAINDISKDDNKQTPDFNTTNWKVLETEV